MSGHARGKLVVVSGPSGAGKTTVLKRLFQSARGPLVSSVSATTRPPRPGEVDGVDYHFLTPEEFERRRARGEFLECFEVFQSGHWYGTLQSEVTSGLRAGKWVLLEIDVRGAMAVMERYPQAVTIFIRPPSLDDLERRLRDRGTESGQSLEERLGRARQEIRMAPHYRHQVVNDDVDGAVRRMYDILIRSGGE